MGVDDDLVREARKYATPEEFVKAQGEILYHGSPQAESVAKQGFDLKFAGTRSKHAPEDVGIHFTNNKETASAYSEEYLKDFYKTYEETFGKAHHLAENVKNAGTIEAVLDIKNPLVVNQSKQINAALIQKAKDAGYDGIIAKSGTVGGRPNVEYVVFDPSQVKTKNWLLDLWEKAQK